MWDALMSRRKEIVQHPFTFQARGISALIERSQMLQSLMQTLQIIGQSEQLVAAFAQTVDFGKLVNLLFELSNIDPKSFTKSQRDTRISELTSAAAQGAGGAQATSAGAAQVGSALSSAGVSR